MDADGFPLKGQLRPDARAPVSRIAPTTKGKALARWFWVPEWHLASGEGFEMMTLPYPACQLVVEPHGVAVHGPVTRAWRRRLTGHGWAVGALLWPGTAHALVGAIADVVDAVVPVAEAEELLREVTVTMDSQESRPVRHERSGRLLEQWLVGAAGDAVAADPRATTSRRIVELADGDSAVVRIEDLACGADLSVRTLHRMARTHVGMTPPRDDPPPTPAGGRGEGAQ